MHKKLPVEFVQAIGRLKARVRQLADNITTDLERMNARFQEMVAAQYPAWAQGSKDIILTSQFIARCLKPNWDLRTEKAVLFIFDGMRYDIWDELLCPALSDRMDLLADLPGSALLPSETHVTRKAISAGDFPDTLDYRALGEDKLLQQALQREFGYTGTVETMTPETAASGETVRYRAGNLDVYIFELCDNELHKIRLKTLPDGREVPGRPLAFIYQQLLKNIIDNEVMAIMRKLTPGTKVFITADHGFARVGRKKLWFDDQDSKRCEGLCLSELLASRSTGRYQLAGGEAQSDHRLFHRGPAHAKSGSAHQ